ncbi:MAG: redox-regulated ATPase YchF [Bacteroidetes bacterium]|nr:MAG: redox-regulated ATPase YchF [Bacteroidota bacterium]
MPLRCGIIGIAGSGKTTLFNSLSSHRATPGSVMKANMGTMVVPDHRLSGIDQFVRAAKVIPTTVEMVDIPGLAKGGTGLGSQFLSEIRNVDALIHVLRCFDDPLNPHIEGSVDPVRDRETVDLELQIRDLESVEKKILRLEKIAKSGDKEARRGIDVLLRLKSHLESFQSARTAAVNPEDRKFMDDLFLLSDKPVMYVCNVDDDAAVSGNGYSIRFLESLNGEAVEVLILAARLEAEIAELDEEEDRQAFLDDAGLHEPGINRLVRSAFHLLDLQTFFTACPKEVRAWTITRGMTAPEAAGVIHSDMERGFIRAEVIKSEDFIRLGSEHACRDAGKLMVEGKNYIVRDGDMLHIRFNV